MGLPGRLAVATVITMVEWDSEAQERSTRAAAAVTDQELVADIRRALAEVASRSAVWWDALPRGHSGLRLAAGTDQAAHDALQQAVAAAAALADDDVAGAVRAARPVLRVWWPDPGGEAAVERLRAAAMHRTQIRREAREIVGWREP